MSDPTCRIYLILPPAFDAALAPALAQALEGNDVASLLLWLEAGEDAAWTDAGDAILPLAHARGIPLLAGGHHVPRVAGADGVHVEGDIRSIKAAHAVNAPRRMVGAGGIDSRHDAMEAAETGIDYVMFGSADPAAAQPIAFERVLALTSWWAEIFQVPCVAAAASAQEALDLARAGADFVAVGSLVWQHPSGPAQAISELARALAQDEVGA